MRKHFPLLAVLAFSALTPLAAHASLKGLSGIRVEDPTVSADLSSVGVTKKVVKKEIEDILTTSHIPESKDSYPLLDVDISSVQSSMDVVCYSVDIHVYDVVQRTNSAKTMEPAIIWSDGNLGTADQNDAGGDIRISLDELVERFIVNYAVDNPTAGVVLTPISQSHEKEKRDSD